MQTTKINRPYHNVAYSAENEKYFMEVALPGIGKKDVTVEIKENLLVVTTREEELASDINFFGNTWKYRLPHRTDINGINASINNGILHVEIPLKVMKRSIKVA